MAGKRRSILLLVPAAGTFAWSGCSKPVSVVTRTVAWGPVVHTPLSYVVMAELLAISIGLFAGVLPASRAARLEPVEALRSE